MKDNNKKYWKGIEELSNDPQFLKNAHNEFPEFLPVKESHSNPFSASGTDRRDFLKLLGFGVAAVSLAACEAPVNRAIPYVNKPEEIEPGVANWYASTYMNAGEYCSVLVKTREGRPIKIEGNALSSVTKGGTSARVQASVLSLYDQTRLRDFTSGGNKAEQSIVDTQIISKLNEAQNAGKGIRIISSTIMSPSTKNVIEDFKAKYPNTVHVTYDANSVSGLIKANQASFGKAVVPSYDFSKANVVVSFSADFLGTWISPVEYARQYITNRKLGRTKKTMSKHYQFESNLSLTGSNADVRVPIKPSQEAFYIAEIHNRLSPNKITANAVKSDVIDKVVADLTANKGKSLVVSGSNDPSVQLMVNEINNALGNYGKTIDLNTPSFQRQGDDAAMLNFIQEANAGKIGAVLFYNSNPVYDHPKSAELIDGLKKIGLKVSFAERGDETASLCDYICPDNHYLESWNDAEPKKGFFSLAQPTISPIFKGTRPAQESLLLWAGKKQDFYSYIQNYWKENILRGGSFQSSWDKALHDGVYENGGASKSIDSGISAGTSDSTATASVASATAMATEPTVSYSGGNVNYSAISESLNQNYKGGEIELKLYEKVTMGNGNMANNPWLQEMPDVISKACWDNYLAVPIKLAKDKGWAQGDLVNITVNGKKISKAVPVLIQPGQANNTVSLAIGYGREKAGKSGDGIGANAYPFVSVKNGTLNYDAYNISIEKAGGNKVLAQTQTHHTIMARPIIQDATLAEYQKDAGAGRFHPKIHTSVGEKKPEDVTVWYEHEKPNHLWGMVIDLNSCIGCNACAVACQVENNVPVVGRDEVVNRREMHWLRIDRYYSSDADPKETGVYFKGDVKAMEDPSENPQVTFQPMLCQHCNHAPCETVCPVAATTHSSEGINQMAYNRCVGTRYCANNCPYKVRRFNWFKYHDNEKFPDNQSMNNALGKMVLNPDVTVRSRGVMEKCTFCIQRIQEGKLNAKKEKRRPVDGEIVTACASACPTNAITFGDQNDPGAQIYKQLHSENKERAYHVLEEVNTQPNINYLTKIRNI